MDAIADFAARFAEFWKRPSAERLPQLLCDDVVLRQPLSAPMRGLSAAQREFSKIFAWLPDLRGEVDRWSGSDPVLFVEFRLRARLSGRPLEWPAVDRFTLRGDKAIERISYFDGLALTRQVLARPGSWWSWWRSGVARPWR